jgi:hypothetical protein
MNPEILGHSADCKCAGCRVFWWELFVTDNERDVMDAEATPLGVGPLEPEDGV